MENIISYYYNLKVENSKLINNTMIIESNNTLFIAKELKDEEMLNKILPYLDTSFYLPIINKEGNNYFLFNNKKYVLFNAISPSIPIYDNFKIIPLLIDVEIDYSKIWKNNIDFFIKKITQMESSEIEEINCLNYYIGVSENAIILNEKAKKMPGTARLTVSHYRISYPNYNLTYNDPTELMTDYISRDIAEYIKVKFFFDTIDISEVLKFISKFNLNDKETMFLIARLMYPNYYFDAISEKNIDKQKIIIEKRRMYEKFIADVLRQIKTTNIFINIQWLE